ncbi:hypothetical protein P170DRAFT_438681 [Aspergillus steynii IBT 23096]|uniref:Uncharacterized protein n=1 Tax=Aspergillus steynii IBT 23096 TaxID=1392250 RepID=A0A2I2G261_9EURO|nr:uncharacterized protein P170DRAFT_438681 [Aspergillus steynii IBT 23096]PLB46970.1 hypothetical protein P170DRAFT_438681 [Aspergillus steynii IBT 23096]
MDSNDKEHRQKSRRRKKERKKRKRNEKKKRPKMKADRDRSSAYLKYERQPPGEAIKHGLAGKGGSGLDPTHSMMPSKAV